MQTHTEVNTCGPADLSVRIIRTDLESRARERDNSSCWRLSSKRWLACERPSRDKRPSVTVCVARWYSRRAREIMSRVYSCSRGYRCGERDSPIYCSGMEDRLRVSGWGRRREASVYGGEERESRWRQVRWILGGERDKVVWVVNWAVRVLIRKVEDVGVTEMNLMMFCFLLIIWINFVYKLI